MSALLSEMISNYEEEYGESVLTIKARTELAKLRADLVAAQQRAETLQRERDEARAQLAELMATMAAYGEVEPPNGEPLAPRRCVTCARDAAREMREAVVKHCKDLANRTDICREAIDTKRNRMVRGEHIIYENLAAYFNSLPLPAECADCNPLEPEAENEATR